MYGEVCVCKERRRESLDSVYWESLEGTPPWSEITRNTFMSDAEELWSSTSEGLTGRKVLNQQITFISLSALLNLFKFFFRISSV